MNNGERQKIDLGQDPLISQLDEQVAATVGEYEEQLTPAAPPKKTDFAPIFLLVIVLAVIVGVSAFLLSQVNLRALVQTITQRPMPMPTYSIVGPDGHVDPNKVFRLSTQDQAQALLLASLGHDDHAIQLLSDSSPEWRGRLHWTDDLNRLFTRAMNSRDLRLRRAAMRVMLAADNLGTDQASTEYAEGLAHSGGQGSAEAVMDLGAIAGNGVDQERIVGEIAQAEQSSDLAVKKNAVLALGMSGTDKALQKLVTIYEEPGDLGVREQAICGVAESGAFTRTQRMAAVPQLISYCHEGSCAGAISGWKYQALRDITDAQVASNDAAWQQWYAKNGSSTLERFRAEDWWRIHGDE